MVRLAAYMRQNPAAVSQTPAEVALSSGVDVEVVTAVLAARAQVRESTRVARPQPLLDLWSRFRSFLNRLEKYILHFVALSSLVVAITTGLVITVGSVSSGGRLVVALTEIVPVVMIFGTALVHMVLFFRYGKIRYPLWSGLIVWGIMSLVTSFLAVMGENNVGVSRLFLAFMVTIVMGILGVGYTAFGSVCALLGAYRKILKEEKLDRELTRQELLERLFEIDEALSESKYHRQEQETEWFAAFKQVAFPLSPVGGFLMSVLFLVCAAFVPVPTGGRADVTLSFLLVYVGIGGLSTLMQILFSYMGGTPWRGIVNSVLFSLGGFVAGQAVHFVAQHYKLATYLTGPMAESFKPSNLIVGTIMAVIFGAFAGLGAVIQQRTLNERRRRRNDPQTLLQEMVQIQLRLNPSTSIKCVSVIDAARSSQMKANADPLVAEWSFRAYQEFLQKIVEEYGGVIHSTAGDGAVAIFDDCPSAWKASQAIQTRIGAFNTEVSRLQDNFRLRVGLHCDTVSGDLNEVQFAAVIDIAAHAEAASQIGGICVTEPVKQLLPEEKFAEMPDLVDGYRAFIALKPTMDA